MATVTSFGFACRSCRPACRMRSGSCEALFRRGALGTAPRTTMSGVPASWRYRGPPAAPLPPSPHPGGLLFLMALAWSRWEEVPNGAVGTVQEAEHKPPLRCSRRLLAPFPAPALLALPSFSTAGLAPGPASLSEAVALESPLVPLPLLWPRCCYG